MAAGIALFPQRSEHYGSEQYSRVARGRWLSVLAHLHPKYGGLSAVVPGLASVLTREHGFEVELNAFCFPDEQYAPDRGAAAEPAVRYWPLGRRQWLDRTLRARFRRELAGAGGVHIHGLWEQSTLAAARAARSLRKPYIVSAHGMLEPWALNRSRRKKQLYAALFERSTLRRATCLHALTRAEAQSYRLFGSRAPIAVIPNAVSVPHDRTPDLFLKAFPSARGKRLVLFLGRLHEKKGGDLLLDAWGQIAGRAPGAMLVLAGAREPNHLPQLEWKAAPLIARGSLLLTGHLDAPMKWSALAAAECFVLPSFSEGLSIATLEAMGSALPVIVTEQSNLPEVAEHHCGWQVRADRDALRAAVDQVLANPPAANRAIGARGAALVGKRFSWPVVGEQMAELYDWVAHGVEPTTFSLERDGRRRP